MPPGILNSGVAVDVGEQAEAESVAVVGGIREAIDEHAGGRRLKRLSNTIVELIVNNRTPVFGFLIGHRLHIYTENTLTGHRNEFSNVQEETDTDTFNAHLRFFLADTCRHKLPGATDASIRSAINLTHQHNYFFQTVPCRP